MSPHASPVSAACACGQSGASISTSKTETSTLQHLTDRTDKHPTQALVPHLTVNSAISNRTCIIAPSRLTGAICSPSGAQKQEPPSHDHIYIQIIKSNRLIQPVVRFFICFFEGADPFGRSALGTTPGQSHENVSTRSANTSPRTQDSKNNINTRKFCDQNRCLDLPTNVNRCGVT